MIVANTVHANDSAAAPTPISLQSKLVSSSPGPPAITHVVGTTIQIVENLCETLDLRAGSRVLDVAAGNGNATLAASGVALTAA